MGLISAVPGGNASGVGGGIGESTDGRSIFGITNSWSLDAVWAAGLGLADEAARLLDELRRRAPPGV